MPDSSRPPAVARIVHRTRDRMRLRIPSRRNDLGFFLTLYENLRKQPEIDEVSLNPRTGSLLVWHNACPEPQLRVALARGDLISVDDPREHPKELRDRQRFQTMVNNMRMVVFFIMLLISIQQLRKGQYLAPALTLLLSFADLAFGLRHERDGADHDEISALAEKEAKEGPAA